MLFGIECDLGNWFRMEEISEGENLLNGVIAFILLLTVIPSISWETGCNEVSVFY